MMNEGGTSQKSIPNCFRTDLTTLPLRWQTLT